MAKLLDIVKPGVVTGEDVQKIFAYAKANNFAIPAVNCVGSDSVNAVLETAARVKAPVIIQFSNGGAAFYAGKGIKPTSGARPDVLGAIAGAKHVHTLAKEYGVPPMLVKDAHGNLIPLVDLQGKFIEGHNIPEAFAGKYIKNEYYRSRHNKI